MRGKVARPELHTSAQQYARNYTGLAGFTVSVSAVMVIGCPTPVRLTIAYCSSSSSTVVNAV